MLLFWQPAIFILTIMLCYIVLYGFIPAVAAPGWGEWSTSLTAIHLYLNHASLHTKLHVRTAFAERIPDATRYGRER